MFHALFALSFLGAYLTAEGERWRALHVTLGYTFAGLLLARVLYGLFGPRQAGLGLLWRKLLGAPAWLRTMVQAARAWPQTGSLRALPWRQGQNLLMALAIVLLLVLALPLTLSGYATYQEWGDILGGEPFAELHEMLGNALLAVVLMHVGLVLLLSLLRRRNLAMPMLSGRVEGAGPDLVKHDRVALALVLLLAVLAFGGWQWQTTPSGLLPSAASASTSTERGHQDDDD
jgi:cytochrome b